MATLHWTQGLLSFFYNEKKKKNGPVHNNFDTYKWFDENSNAVKQTPFLQLVFFHNVGPEVYSV